MTAAMKKFLTLASGPKGSPVRNVDAYLAAHKAGWVRLWGTPQNSTEARYEVVDAGREALAAHV